MTSFYKIVAFASAFVAVSSASGQTSLLDSPEAQSLVRVSYQNSSELPDGIAFVEVLNVLRQLETQDVETGIVLVQTGMDMNEADAIAFYALLMQLLADIDEEVLLAQHDLACATSNSEVEEDRVYEILNAIDDVRALVSAEQLSLFSRDIGETLAEQLIKWIREEKLNIVYVLYEHERATERSGLASSTILTQQCNRLSDMILRGDLQ